MLAKLARQRQTSLSAQLSRVASAMRLDEIALKSDDDHRSGLELRLAGERRAQMRETKDE